MTIPARCKNPRAVDTDQRLFEFVREVTQACDLACKHCRADARPERHPEELTTAEGKALLADVREFGDGQLVVVSGGDPMVRDDVVEPTVFGTDLGLEVAMTPSGTAAPTADRIRELADAGSGRLALSLDGSRTTTRRVPGGAG